MGHRVGAPPAPELEHEAGGCGGGEGRRVGAGARVGSGTRVVDDAERTDLWSSTGAVPRALLNASSPLTAERETSGSAARRVPARFLSRSSSDESDDRGSMPPVEPYCIVLDTLRDPEPARVTVPFHGTLCASRSLAAEFMMSQVARLGRAPTISHREP